MGIVDVHHPLKLISECFVRPDKLPEAAKHPFHLGPLDLIFLMKDPIQSGLLFPFPNHPTRPDIQPILDKLKLSLSIALLHFYPLAGRFVVNSVFNSNGCCIYLDCTKGPGARFIHATVDLTVSDILSAVYVHPAVRSFFDLGEITVNFYAPMVTIQVTELLDGVFLGFTVSHSVVDGTSFVHFVSALSEIFRSDTPNRIEISRIPQYKIFIPDGSDPIIKLPVSPDEVVMYMTRSDPGVLRERIFHFSAESIASVKAKANDQEGQNEISSFMALSGLVWRSMTRAQNLGPDENTPCHFPVNARTRVDPCLSEDYFGNIFASVRVVCKVDQLLGQGLGWAARTLAQEIKKVNHQGICEHLKKLDHLVSLGPTGRDGSGSGNYVLMGWSHRFDMYGPEFGFGRALAVLTGCAGQKNGKVTVNPGREGGGSMDLQISLSPHMMNALESDEEFMSYVTLV